MPRKKLKRFAEIETFPNTFTAMDAGLGREWLKGVFGNAHPLILELGCGKGEYSLALAQYFRNRNVVGIDRKGERIWKGAKFAIENNVGNVAFLRARIEELGDFFETGQVDQIWIPFPDPLSKKRQAKHRLLSERFLATYKRILRPGGEVHLKTDDGPLADYAVEIVNDCGGVVTANFKNLYSSGLRHELLQVQTTFERRHLALGKTIKYVSFTFLDSFSEDPSDGSVS